MAGLNQGILTLKLHIYSDHTSTRLVIGHACIFKMVDLKVSIQFFNHNLPFTFPENL